MGEDAGRGFVWVQDPATGETTGQITLTNAKAGGVAGGGSRPVAGAESDGRGRPAAGGVRDWDQDRVDAEFFALVGDLVGAPHEIVDPHSGEVVGRSTQTLYGQRSWRGEQASPLLFAGQYYDEESGWAYNRFRYYSPEAGVYNAQDPLGVTPRVASAQGYVDHAGHWFDFLGLHECPAGGAADRLWQKKEVAGKTVYQQVGTNVFDPYQLREKPLKYRVAGETEWTNVEAMQKGYAPLDEKGRAVHLHHIGQDDASALVEVRQSTHQTYTKQLHIYSGLPKDQWPKDVTPVDRAAFREWKKKEYWPTRAKDYL